MVADEAGSQQRHEREAEQSNNFKRSEPRSVRKIWNMIASVLGRSRKTEEEGKLQEEEEAGDGRKKET
jgi:hypothetical protein